MPAIKRKPANLPGVGPDAPTVTAANGGQQSVPAGRFDLEPPLAMAKIAAVQAVGAAKYGIWNWTALPVEDHINHAKAHLHAYVSGDTSEGDPIEHLARAACRVLYALDRALADKAEEPISYDPDLPPIPTGFEYFRAGTVSSDRCMQSVNLLAGACVRPVGHPGTHAKDPRCCLFEIRIRRDGKQDLMKDYRCLRLEGHKGPHHNHEGKSEFETLEMLKKRRKK